jgi:ribonuclease HI
VVLISGRHRLEKSEGFRLTTNNRMELLAVITGLEALKKPGSRVMIYTDSKYVADAVEKGWVFKWESKGFRKKKNPDLWVRFLRIYRHHTVKFTWIKGHANNAENEICDRLAVEASRSLTLSEDTGYRQDDDKNELF